MTDTARRDAWLKAVIGVDAPAVAAAAAAANGGAGAGVPAGGQRRAGIQIGQRPVPPAAQPAAPAGFAAATATPGRQRSGVQIGNRPPPPAAAPVPPIPAATPDQNSNHASHAAAYNNVTDEERNTLAGIEEDEPGRYHHTTEEERAALAAAEEDEPGRYHHTTEEERAALAAAEEDEPGRYHHTTEEERAASVAAEDDGAGRYQNMTREELDALEAAAVRYHNAPEDERVAAAAAEASEDTAPVGTAPAAGGARSDIGLKGKAVGAGYAGEHNMEGWRAQQSGADPEETRGTRTRLYTEEERSAHTLDLGDDGSFRQRDGGSITDGRLVGYAMDPVSGEMVGFGLQARGVMPDGTIVPGTRNSLADQRDQGIDVVTEVPHHSTVLGGDVVLNADGTPKLDRDGKPIMKSREAASAGFVRFNLAGQLVEISNQSGHYKPGTDALVQAIEHLSRQGAYASGELADARGRAVTPDSPAGKLRAALDAQLAELSPLLAKLPSLTAAMAGEQSAEGDAAAREAAAIEKKVAAVNAAAKTLEGLAIAPDGKMRDGTKAEFVVPPRKNLAGGAFVQAPTEKVETSAFLRTGGGQAKEALVKSEMLGLVKAKGEEGLRAAAEIGAVEGQGAKTVPTDDEVAAALAALSGAPTGDGAPSTSGAGDTSEAIDVTADSDRHSFYPEGAGDGLSLDAIADAYAYGRDEPDGDAEGAGDGLSLDAIADAYAYGKDESDGDAEGAGSSLSLDAIADAYAYGKDGSDGEAEGAGGGLSLDALAEAYGKVGSDGDGVSGDAATAPTATDNGKDGTLVAPTVNEPRTEADWSALRDTLNWILLKLPDHTADATTEHEIHGRLVEAIDAQTRRDPTTPKLIEELGKALAKASEAKKAADAPFDALKAAIDGAIEAGEDNVDPRLTALRERDDDADADVLEEDWRDAKSLLDSMREAVKAGANRAKKADAAKRGAAMESAARKAASFLNPLIHRTDAAGAPLVPAAALKNLQTQLDAFRKAAEPKS